MAKGTRRIQKTEGERVIGFEPRVVKAPFLLRCGALTIDYLVIVSIPVVFLLFGRSLGEDGSALLNGDLNNTGWLIAVIVAIADLVLLPAVAGRTVGKMLTGLRVVNKKGAAATVKSMVFRQTVGYFTVLITFGLGFLVSAFNSTGRALHDWMSGTVVIKGQKRYLD